MKKRLFIIGIVVFAFMLLAGVGYATWVISQSMEQGSQGNIVVETVSDERLNVTVDYKDANVDSFYFNHPETMNTANHWLTAKDEVKTENLEVTYVVTIVKQGGAAFTATTDVDLTATFADKLSDDTELSAITAFMQNAAFEEVGTRTLSADSKTLTIEVKASIEWGTLTGGANPYDYFNAKGSSEKLTDATLVSTINTALGTTLTVDSSYADFALAYLEYFNTHFNGVKFNVSVNIAYH